MTQNNIFTIAKRNVEGQDMLYQSLKLVNNIWVLLELKIQPKIGSKAVLSMKTLSLEVTAPISHIYETIINSI